MMTHNSRRFDSTTRSVHDARFGSPQGRPARRTRPCRTCDGWAVFGRDECMRCD